MTVASHAAPHAALISDSARLAEVEALIDRKLDERLGAFTAQLAHLEKQLVETQARTVSNRATLVVFSGEFDKLIAAFVIATGAAAMGLEVSMYFTFWGLAALKKTTRYEGKILPEKLLAWMLPDGPASVPTSRMNFLGAGPLFFKAIMKHHSVESLPDLIDVAREMGVKMIACQMSMGVMGIKGDELLEGLSYGGVATYLGDASDSKITLFI